MEGQGLGADGPGGLIAKFGTVAIFSAFPPFLTSVNRFRGLLASFGDGLELRPWWRDACLPNETEGV